MSRIDELDAATPERFAAAVGPLFEDAPRFLARLAAARPFGDWPALFERARAIAHAMPEAERIELIDAHPRLGAPPASVSAHSFREQGYGREASERLAADATAEREHIARELATLNEAYESRFGFRYCVFVAGRPRSELLPGLRDALAADRPTEIARAIDAVVDIAIDRHRRMSS